ncbi:enolase 4 isoform X1 [Sorex araneus]|uniref:enolase 4 isoform X1 n=1 Tax=Sorex araneus TaxID=42254 RepID=UPI002433BF2E|nr:enolase 4 isoform X1 [Sorex araneus]
MGDDGDRRGSGSARELQKLRRQAMRYYQENQVPRRLEELLNATFYLQPADVYGHLANCLSELATPPTICKVVGKNVLDGLGFPTLQVEIFCTVQNSPKNICSTAISTHFQVQENSPSELLEVEETERSEEVSTALQWINEELSEQLQGQRPCNQAEVDQLLRTFFEEKVQEDKEKKELEKKISAMPVPSATTSSIPPARKKGQKAGKKEALVEKPVTPAEPAEPVLCGSLAIGAVSLAIAKASAVLAHKPLYLSIAALKHSEEPPTKLTVPLLMVTMLSCGKSSPGKLNLMKEVICIPHPGLSAKQGVAMLLEVQKYINRMEMLPSPKTETKKGLDGGKRGQAQTSSRISHLGCLTMGCDTLEQPLQLIQGICTNLGLELGTHLHLGINCAAQELMDYSKGKYEVMMGTYKNMAEMVDLYVDLINKFPSIIALIDPFRKEDSEQWESIYNALGSRCHIIAGAESKSISKLLEDGTISNPKSSGLIIRHTNQTTMSDLVAITDLAESKKLISILGSAEGESCDDSLADLATGLGVRFVKLGGLSRGERVTKYNRLFAIEEELVQNGTLGLNEEHTFSDLNEEEQQDAATPEAAVRAEDPNESQELIFPTEVPEPSA